MTRTCLLRVAALLALCSPGLHAQIYVSPTGSDVTGTGSQTSPYKTIAFAASVAAAGETLMLSAGTFGDDEQIILGSQNLTIVGAGPGATIVQPHPTLVASLPTGPLPGTPVDHRVAITVDGPGRVDVRDLTIDGAFRVPATGRLIGILYRNGADGTIENVELTNVRSDPIRGSREPAAVAVRGDDSMDECNVRIRGCRIHEWGKHGVLAQFNASVEIEYCNIAGAGAGAVPFGGPVPAAIQISDDALAVIRHNVVVDAAHDPVTFAAVGIRLINARPQTRVEANNVARCEDNIYASRQPPGDAELFIQRNKSTHAFNFAVRVEGNTLATVSNNTLHGIERTSSIAWDTATSLNVWDSNNYSNWLGVGSYRVSGGSIIDPSPRTNCDEFKRTDDVVIGQFPIDLVVAQLNGGGQFDMATVNSGSPPTVSIIIEEAGGHFVRDLTLATSTARAVAVEAGEFDGQPGIDVVAVTADIAPATGNTAFHVFANDGGGQFSLLHTEPMIDGVTAPSEIVVGDVDGDGIDDLAISHAGDSTRPGGGTVYMNGGSGTTWSGTALPGTTLPCLGIAIGPIDPADALPDIALTEGDGTTGLVHVYINDGAGSFTELGLSPFTVGAHPTAVATMDMDGDLQAEILVTSWNGPTAAGQRGSCSILRNALPSAMPIQTVRIGRGPSKITVGDIGNDADPDTIRPDAVIINATSNDYTLLGEWGPAGPSQGSLCVVAPAQPLALSLNDMDGSGFNDLVVIHQGSQIAIFREAEFTSRADLYGAGCPGVEGRLPIISPDGDPAAALLPNPSFGVRMNNARAMAPAAFLLGLPDATLSPCTLTVTPMIVLAASTDATGAPGQPLPIPPSTALDGVEFYCQWLVVDDASSFLNVAMTQGLRVRIGN